MSTKEQERKALEQIRKIVDSLDAGSYIGFAFEGCFELAEENIENDFACSMKDQRDDARREAEQLKEELRKLQGRFAALQDANRHAESEAQQNARNAATWEKKYNDLAYKWTEQHGQEMEKEAEQAKQLKAAELEIMVLKAKLYDFMTK